MRTFNMKSYWDTFKWMMFSNKRTLLSLFGGVMLGAAVIEEMVLATHGVSSGEDEDPFLLITMLVFLTFSGCIWMMCGASRTFADTSKRHSAITLLMHPATNLEKYLARLTYYTVLWFVIALVGSVLGDMLRWCFNALTGWHAGVPVLIMSASSEVNRQLLYGVSAEEVFKAFCLIASTSFWAHSFYVLGSAFFRRNRFLLTSAALCILQVSTGSFVPLLPGVSFFSDGVSWGMTIPTFMLAALHYWLAYVLFTRMQVINNKWINV